MEDSVEKYLFHLIIVLKINNPMTTGSLKIKITINNEDVLRIRATRNDYNPELGYEDRKTWFFSNEMTGTSLGVYVGDNPVEMLKELIKKL